MLYADETSLRRAARRISWTLFAAQSLASAAFLAASTMNPLVATALSGTTAWAGAPTAVYVGGIAVSAVVWGRVSDRRGRRAVLVLGGLAGVLGAAAAATSAALALFPPFLASMLLMGAATSAVQLSRYAAADAHPPAERSRALARVVMGGTVGAVLGPILVTGAARVAGALGQPERAGAYAAGAVLLLGVTGLGLWGLRPAPEAVARAVAALHPSAADGPSAARPVRTLARDPGIRLAVGSLVAAQLVMVLVMVVTAVHMSHHHHGLSSISLTMAAHVAGMYAFSPLSGRLADRLGRPVVIVAGGTLLVAACALAPLSPRFAPLTLALFLLGLGWNLCYVAGSSLLAERLQPAERGKAQGLADFLIGAASATASLGSGALLAWAGYGAVGALGVLVALGATLLAARAVRAGSRAAAPEAAAA